MPTFFVLPRCRKDLRKLDAVQRAAFRAAVEHLLLDMEAGAFRRGLRVKGIQGAPGVFEMTWAPDGRATFHFGSEVRPGATHIVWRRCGTHYVLKDP